MEITSFSPSKKILGVRQSKSDEKKNFFSPFWTTVMFKLIYMKIHVYKETGQGSFERGLDVEVSVIARYLVVMNNEISHL